MLLLRVSVYQKWYAKFLNSLCKTVAETLEDFFKILGGIRNITSITSCSLLRINVADFFFYITYLNNCFEWKASWFFRCFYIKRILGWNLYLLIALSIGSVILSDDLLVMNLLSLIFNEDKAFLKNLFNSFVIRSSSCNISSFSRSLICDALFPLFEKTGLIVFQNILLSVTKDGLRLLKNRFLSFLCKSFSVFFMC